MFKTSFDGDPNIGLYGFATDKYCLLGSTHTKKVGKAMDVPVKQTVIMNTYFTGIFAAGNSSGVILPEFARNYGFTSVDHGKILYLRTNRTAIGNLILANDNGAVISPQIKKHKDIIEEFLGVNVEICTVAGTKICGSAAMVTNKGCIAHPSIKEKEKDILERILEVPVSVGTVNYGSPYVKAGIIANSKSLIVSNQSTGPELGNIVEALGFL